MQAWAPSLVSSVGAADAQQTLASAAWNAACAACHDDYRAIASALPFGSLQLAVRHATLLRLLMKGSLSFEQLLERSKTPGQQLCQDIAALVHTRSVGPV